MTSGLRAFGGLVCDPAANGSMLHGQKPSSIEPWRNPGG
jgi:hypothetical protein